MHVCVNKITENMCVLCQLQSVTEIELFVVKFYFIKILKYIF